MLANALVRVMIAKHTLRKRRRQEDICRVRGHAGHRACVPPWKLTGHVVELPLR